MLIYFLQNLLRRYFLMFLSDTFAREYLYLYRRSKETFFNRHLNGYIPLGNFCYVSGYESNCQ